LSWARLSAFERRKIGLRLQAIHGGQAVQRMYRLRGVDPFAAARAVLAKMRKAGKLKSQRIK